MARHPKARSELFVLIGEYGGGTAHHRFCQARRLCQHMVGEAGRQHLRPQERRVPTPCASRSRCGACHLPSPRDDPEQFEERHGTCRHDLGFI